MATDDNFHKIQITVVGDSHIGKTQLIFSYAEDKFLERHIPTVADEYEVQDISY